MADVRSMAAAQVRNRRLKDVIFGASEACRKAAEKYGREKVTDLTIGTMIGDDGKLAVLPTVDRVYYALPMAEITAYAPIAGLPEYRKAVIDLTFAGQKPAGYTAAVATAGGTGALHQAVANYAQPGTCVLTSDWYWSNYRVIADECGCQLATYTLFDEKQQFNREAYAEKVAELLSHQDSLVSIINTPAHNPTGFSLTEADWESVLDVTKHYAAQGKKMILVVDIAYIDYAGEKRETRAFMQRFANLPANVLVLFAFSMSKSYTLYGQRTGALIGLSSSKDVIEEFAEVTKYSCRATWSNISRGAQALLVALHQDKAAYAAFEKERESFYQLVQHRGDIFMQEARECGLNALPYKGGFFLAVPASDPAAVCNELHKELIFAVPLKMGVRIAACAVSTEKMKGVAAKVLKALQTVEED